MDIQKYIASLYMETNNTKLFFKYEGPKILIFSHKYEKCLEVSIYVTPKHIKVLAKISSIQQ